MDCFKVKLNYEDAQPPTRGSNEAAGYDLYSHESETVVPKQIKLIDTGISIKVPEGTSTSPNIDSLLLSLPVSANCFNFL